MDFQQRSCNGSQKAATAEEQVNNPMTLAMGFVTVITRFTAPDSPSRYYINLQCLLNPAREKRSI